MEKTIEQNADLSSLVQLYDIIFTKLNQEGDGLWRRFNFMTAINLAFYGAYGFVWNKGGIDGIHFYLLTLICIFGLAMSLWTFYVLVRLWGWHQHWRDELKKIEAAFPSRPGWVRPLNPHSTQPEILTSDPGEGRSIWLGYTQPFVAMFIIVWLGVLSVTVLDKFEMFSEPSLHAATQSEK